MAVVVDPKDVDQFLAYSAEENLEAVEVAVVTEDPRLVLKWRGKEIVNISRAFLDTNGAHQETEVFVEIPHRVESYFNRKDETGTFEEVCKNTLSDLNVCSQKRSRREIRQLYRSSNSYNAIWWKIPDDTNSDNGRKTSSIERRMRYSHNDELWI